MPISGVYLDKVSKDVGLAKALRTDDMERFRAVPKTVMINQWQEDLNWIIIDSTYPAQIDRRYALLSEKLDMVIDRVPGENVRTAEIELRDAVVEYVLAIYPDYFQRNDNLVLSRLTGLAIDVGPDGADPLVAIALLASEDMLLLLPEARGANGQVTYSLKAGALLFPNDWALRSHFKQPEPSNQDAIQEWREARQRSLKAARLGKTPYEIHDRRVAHYMEHFAARVDMFFARMEPGLRTWRRNWSMKMSNELFLHSDAAPVVLPEPTPQNWAEYGYLRAEHQTFSKLPTSGAVVFSIKTYLWKLSELVKNPVALDALIVANDNLAPAMFDYRATVLPTFRQFLEQYRPRRNAPVYLSG